jgi:TM2 domain-containing membrane protein YozV
MSKEEIQNEIMIEQLKQLKELNAGAKKPSKIIYVLLAWFLGGFGVHEFYRGRSGKGVIKLMFFWTGIPAIIAFFQGVGALFNSRDFK